MESATLNKNQEILIALITAPHGIKGYVKIKPFFSEYFDIEQYKLFDQNGVSYQCVYKHNLGSGQRVVAVNGIENRNEAEKLRGKKLYINRSELPELDADDFYYYDLLGLSLKLRDGELYGQIVNVVNFGAGDIVEVSLPDSRENVMLPMIDEVFKEINLAKGYAIVAPEGFV